MILRRVLSQGGGRITRTTSVPEVGTHGFVSFCIEKWAFLKGDIVTPVTQQLGVHTGRFSEAQRSLFAKIHHSAALAPAREWRLSKQRLPLLGFRGDSIADAGQLPASERGPRSWNF